MFSSPPRKRRNPWVTWSLYGLPALGVAGGLWYLFTAVLPGSRPATTAPPSQVVTTLPPPPVVPPKPAATPKSVAAPTQKTASAPAAPASTLPLRYQGKTFKGGNADFSQKVVALTFDDGPWPVSTKAILDILRQNQIKATFFCLGRSIQNNPELLQAVAGEGHVIGNHTWSHTYNRLSPAAAKAEIENTTLLIEQTAGIRPELFRPPGGKLYTGPAAYAASKKYGIILWNVVSGDDVRSTTPQKEIKNVLDHVKPGAVIIMHDGGGHHPTVAALPQIIAGLKQKGYGFVTVPELMKLQDEALAALIKPRSQINPNQLPANQLPANSAPAPAPAAAPQ